MNSAQLMTLPELRGSAWQASALIGTDQALAPAVSGKTLGIRRCQPLVGAEQRRQKRCLLPGTGVYLVSVSIPGARPRCGPKKRWGRRSGCNRVEQNNGPLACTIHELS